MVLEYTGEDCSASTNDQEGKAKCSGDPGGQEPVSVVYTGKDPDKITVSPYSGIDVGETFSVTATGRNELHANTKLEILDENNNDVLLQALEIHTSCSKALSVGDQFGSMRLVELETTEGGIVIYDPDPDYGTACSAPDYPEGTPCDSRLVEAVFEYTGKDCLDPLSNPQDGKATCSGNPEGNQVDVLYTGKDPDMITVAPSSNIDVGDTFRVTATGRNELHSNTKLQIQNDSGILQALEIHTSCSQPLALGDEFGSLRLVEFTTKEGGAKAIGDPDAPIFFDDCSVPSAPPAPHCTSKVLELGLRYLGGDCSSSDNLQDKPEERCTGSDPGAGPVSITVTKDADKVSASPDSGINIGDVVTFTHSDGELRADTKFDVTGPGFTQSLKIHTSCSKPLNLGDRFGAFEVYSIDRKDDGFVSFGGQVEYQYKVTNPSGYEIKNVKVTDSNLGVIADNLSIPANGYVMLFKTATIFEYTTNTVVVEQDGKVCDEDTVEVTVVEPPPGLFTCDKPIDELTMIWDGIVHSDGTVVPTIIDIKAWKGSVGSELLVTVYDVKPGDEVTVSGYAGSPNDVYWEIFLADPDNDNPPVELNKIGESVFHLSCSDDNMNGQEDCGKRQGDGKDKPGFINDWILEGMVDASGTLNCTP